MKYRRDKPLRRRRNNVRNADAAGITARRALRIALRSAGPRFSSRSIHLWSAPFEPAIYRLSDEPCWFVVVPWLPQGLFVGGDRVIAVGRFTGRVLGSGVTGE